MTTISLPVSDELLQWLRVRASTQGCDSLEQYIEDLIRRDVGWEPRWIEERLLEALDSLDRGEGIELTPQVWERKKRELLERIRRQRGEVA